jgi:hypothetical protein
MADTQTAPQVPAGLQPIPALGGSITQAQEALLSLEEPEEETPQAEEAQPTEVEESQPEEEDKSFEEETEEEAEEESEEESEEPDEGSEETLYAVTVNGEEQQVTLDELMSGYSRQSDYTRKTQDVAKERKQMGELQAQYASEIHQARAERQQYLESLNQIIANSASNLDKFTNVDWESIKENDPIEYVTKREEFREAQEKVQAMQRDQYMAHQKQLEDNKIMRTRALQEESGKLVEVLPGWGEPDKQKKIVSTIREYASGQGFTEEELNSLVDHRSLLVLMKAQKYDAMQNSDVKSKKLKNKPRVIRSGKGITRSSSDKSKRAVQMKRLRGTGHIDDASALLEDFIDI